MEGEVPCPHAPGHLSICNHYLQVASWWVWISHDTTLAASWASSGKRFGPYTSWAPLTIAPIGLSKVQYDLIDAHTRQDMEKRART